jgi:hypothetical protein
MPVLPNQGIIFDSLRPGDAETHVNHRKPETWVVSFRGGPGGPGTGHYRNPIAAAEATRASSRPSLRSSSCPTASAPPP